MTGSKLLLCMCDDIGKDAQKLRADKCCKLFRKTLQTNLFKILFHFADLGNNTDEPLRPLHYNRKTVSNPEMD